MPRLTQSYIRGRAGALTDAIEDHSTQLSTLYSERLGMWKVLVARYGWRHKDIAALFRVKTVTVSAALAKDAKR